VSRRTARPPDPRWLSWRTGLQILAGHGLFRYFGDVGWREVDKLVVDRGYGHVTTDGQVVCNKKAQLDPDEWAWVVGHLLLHRGLGHLAEDRQHDTAGRAAACLEVNRFLREARMGREAVPLPAELPRGDLTTLEWRWRQEGVPAEFASGGPAGFGPDIVAVPVPAAQRVDWPAAFAAQIARAAADAIDMAGGARASMSDPTGRRTVWERARRWFVSSYPLLGGLASTFAIIGDADLARARHISVAAVHAAAGEIYINPLAGLSETEWRFVLAHEMLHAALRHGDRVGPRDPYLWNVAADYVINGWLIEMGVGDAPDGVLFDSTLSGLSAEAVYDTIAIDLRRYRKLATLRGRGLGDVLGDPARCDGPRRVLPAGAVHGSGLSPCR
jgi:hypothetical protein